MLLAAQGEKKEAEAEKGERPRQEIVGGADTRLGQEQLVHQRQDADTDSCPSRARQHIHYAADNNSQEDPGQEDTEAPA